MKYGLQHGMNIEKVAYIKSDTSTEKDGVRTPTHDELRYRGIHIRSGTS